MSFKPTIAEAVRDLKLVIAYGILVVLMMIGLTMLRGVIEEQEEATERYAMANCEAGNQTRAILESVLRELASPRDDDGPGDFSRRRELLESILPTIERRDCAAEVRRGRTAE